MKFLDIFSGIGGFRIGMEMAGHECVGHIEWDKFAQRSYIAMHDVKESEYIGWDIKKIRADELPRADCWCFGFPCQDISIAGKQEGFAGHRSSLFFAVTRLIRDLEEKNRPSILFIENVKNLLSVNRGGDFLKLLIELDEIGYDAEWQLLNSKNFGVPQNRERVFIIGHFRGRGGRKVFPIGESSKVYNGPEEDRKAYDIARCLTSKGNANWTGNFVQQPISMTQKKYKEVDIANTLTAKGPSSGRGNYSPVNGVKVIPVLTPDRAEKRQNGRRFKEDGEPMFTLTAQDRHGVAILRPVRTEYGKQIRKDYEAGNLDISRHEFMKLEPREDGISNTLSTVQKDNLLVDWDMDKFAEMMTSPPDPSKQLKDYATKNNFRIRRLTPRECFRLQGVSDEYFERAAAVNSDSQLYKQAGNMVTVNVIYEIGRRL